MGQRISSSKNWKDCNAIVNHASWTVSADFTVSFVEMQFTNDTDDESIDTVMMSSMGSQSQVLIRDEFVHYMQQPSASECDCQKFKMGAWDGGFGRQGAKANSNQGEKFQYPASASGERCTGLDRDSRWRSGMLEGHHFCCCICFCCCCRHCNHCFRLLYTWSKRICHVSCLLFVVHGKAEKSDHACLCPLGAVIEWEAKDWLLEKRVQPTTRSHA